MVAYRPVTAQARTTLPWYRQPKSQAMLGSFGPSLLAMSAPHMPTAAAPTRASLMGPAIRQAMTAGTEAEQYQEELRRQGILDARAEAAEGRLVAGEERAVAQAAREATAEQRRAAEFKEKQRIAELRSGLGAAFSPSTDYEGTPTTTAAGTGLLGTAQMLSEFGFPDKAASLLEKHALQQPKTPDVKQVYDKTRKEWVYRTPDEISKNPNNFGKPVETKAPPDVKQVYDKTRKEWVYRTPDEISKNPNNFGKPVETKAPPARKAVWDKVNKETVYVSNEELNNNPGRYTAVPTPSSRRLQLIQKQTNSDRNDLKEGDEGYFDKHDTKELEALKPAEDPLKSLIRDAIGKTPKPMPEGFDALKPDQKIMLLQTLEKVAPGQVYEFNTKDGLLKGLYTIENGRLIPYPKGQ